MAANGKDQTCMSCFYSKPKLVKEGVYKCVGNEFPLKNCHAVLSESPDSCSECAEGFGMKQVTIEGDPVAKTSCHRIGIEHCKLGIFLANDVENCLVCKNDYQLGITKTSCIAIVPDKKIPNCQEYTTDPETSNPKCKLCQVGYSLEIDYNTCSQDNDRSKCMITKGLRANNDGTCMRCSTSKSFFATAISEKDNNKQICTYMSYWNTGLKIGVIVLGVLFFSGISFISFKKISRKGHIE